MTKQKGPWLGAVALLLAGLLFSTAAQATYQKIRVPYPDPRQMDRLFFHPDLELMSDADGAYILLSRPELTDSLIARGFKVDVLVPDLEAFYAARERGQKDYGIWHTYQETVDEMNLIHTQFPSLTTSPVSIGTSGEGRSIWAMKVSDNPDVQENEPEVLFDGVHHAREIMTVEDNLHFIRYLCENYATDPAIHSIVDNRQVWFVPILNVDGFVYNQTTYPDGGGMWRKNRRLNSGGCYGVDNNRNYPYQWNGSGSSTNPCDETYRGASMCSEPENQAMRGFINSHHFVVWESYHSVAGMVLFPWGYTTTHTADDALFRQIGAEMARDNGYSVGQPPELLYTVNGGSIDWGYGATGEHPKILAFSTEIGGSDFWPAPSERDGLIAENLHANIYLCQIAGPSLEMTSLAVTGGNGNGRLDPGESASLVLTVQNPAPLFSATNIVATISCQDPYVVLTDVATTFPTLAPLASASSTSDPFDLTIDPACPGSHSVSFKVRMTADNGVLVENTVSFVVGQAPVLYADDFETSGGAWLTDPTHTAQTGAFVRADPVRTNYQPEDDTTPAPGVNCWFTAQNPAGLDGTDDVDYGVAATRSPVINLAGQTHARLDMNYFFGQRTAGDDPTGDWFRIDLSNDGGATFPANLVLIGDVTSAPAWHNLQVDLEHLLPLTSQMVLRVQVSDSPAFSDIIEGGIDDVYIYGGSANQPPEVPALLLPAAGSPEEPCNPTLVVLNPADPESDPLTFGFRVYSDAALTQLVASADGIAQGADSSSWTVVPALNMGKYYWRAYAADPVSRGLYAVADSFTVTSTTGITPCGVAAATVLRVGPNPASGAVRIRYYTPSVPTSRIEIYDASGRRVRSLAGGHWAQGWLETTWDGRSDSGSRAAAGVYWVRLMLPGETRTVRVVQIR